MPHTPGSERRKRAHALTAGLPPGSAVYTGVGSESPVAIHVIDYTVDSVDEQFDPDIPSLETFQARRSVTWVNLDGVHDIDQIQAITKIFRVHPLWVEDLVDLSGRPKVEWHDDQLFMVVRVMEPSSTGLRAEQVGMVLGRAWVLSFQERAGDVWDPVRSRIRNKLGRIRQRGADYLLHALVDAVVDRTVRSAETLEQAVAVLEDEALALPPDPSLPQRLVAMKGLLNELQSAVMPLREGVSTLLRGEAVLLSPQTVPYFNDLHDHVSQLSDIVAGSRERMLAALQLHLAMTSHQMNEVMRWLTVVSSVFIPLTFVTGMYGMNFAHMPELTTPWGYPIVLSVMLLTVVGTVAWFRGRGWL